MPKEFIVAIELGSSKITGIAGKKNLDGSISILAVVKEDATSCIRKGVVYNIDKTVVCLTNIIKKLETALKTKIAHVYVGVGGQSIRSMKNVIVKEFTPEAIVTQEMVDELMDANRNMSYPEQEILNAATQEYKVDQQFQLDPVGIQCSRLEGNFLNILSRKTFYRNLNKCFDNAGIAIAELYLAPLALADNVLTETERRAGCVLVDLGADTTTVSVYFKNILRHLAVIPLGSNNITKDIATMQMEEEEAERMKLKYGSAYTDNNDIDNSLSLSIDGERSIPSRDFINIVEGRLEEIIERNGITNFGDIARSAGLSRDMLKLARGVRKSGGLFSLKSFLLGPSGSVRSVVKDAESLENSDWYQVFLKHSAGILRPEGRSAGDSPMSAKFNIPCKLYQKKAEDDEISFQIPGSVINMKGTQSLYEDMRKMFGKDNVMLKSDFKAQKTFTKEPKARTITRETKDGGDK